MIFNCHGEALKVFRKYRCHPVYHELLKFGNEFWLILFQEYISPKLFALHKQMLCYKYGR